MRFLILISLSLFPSMAFTQEKHYTDTDPEIQALLNRMSLEEKASLCSGKDVWKTKAIERLGIPSIWIADGPHGLRKTLTTEVFSWDAIPATAYPSASALSASWDTALIQKVGEAIGRECQANGIQIINGPGINLKRSPLCGRNFEYYSEDPLLAGKLSSAWIRGVQSQGVGTSLKHFACNNQEYQRHVISAEVDERTLHETYLQAFEIAVKESQPWTVMASYNRINGVWSCENSFLLKDILRDQWNFRGIVVSDWNAVNDRVEGIRAGMNLQMPGGMTDRNIAEAVKNGELDEAELDAVVADVLRITLRADSLREKAASYDPDRHHGLAREAASRCIVLLKNQENILPLGGNGLQRIAVIGSFAREARFQGGGSSRLTPTKVDVPFEEMQRLAGKKVKLTFAAGYPESDSVDEQLIAEAVETARDADVAVIFAGLPAGYESESVDRQHLNMPPNHNQLIMEVAGAQENTVVVLFNGSPILMPWITRVKGVVGAGLNGQATGGAVADVLFGQVNPSGKLAETYPMKLEDNPSYLNWPGFNKKVYYGENIFIGYRYYDTKQIEPLFPFGFGLSYTEFEYSDISVPKSEYTDNETVILSFKVRNNGKMAGNEIVQLYVKDVHSSLPRPDKELRDFAKVHLEPGEQKEVTFRLDRRDFAFYDPAVRDWAVESGDFSILIGSSSRDIKLRETISYTATRVQLPILDRYSTIGQWMDHPRGKELMEQLTRDLTQVFGPFDESREHVNPMVRNMLRRQGIYKLVDLSQGQFTEEMLDSMIDQVNR